MSIVDANIVLRYLLDDHAELSPKAAEILEQQLVALPVELMRYLFDNRPAVTEESSITQKERA